MSTRRKSGIKRRCYRNGVAAVEETFRASVLHGRRRTWHRNGRIATEEFYDQGLLHGLCRQWSESGKLLGTFRMRHGTGVQKSWHDNGRLNLEFTTVNGQFCGRSRLWLCDGTRVSDDIFLNGRNVTAEQYRKAAAQDRRLPKLRGRSTRVPANNRKTRQHIHRVFVSTLLRKPNRCEACAWLEADVKKRRSLGHFKREADALDFVRRLYAAGAPRVIVPDIYFSKAGDHFADSLLVRLPAEIRRRRAIRRACARLQTAELGAVEPANDIGETHLYLSMA